MRKPTGKIAMLPEAVRGQINRKIRDGWQYHTIKDWLFGQRADQDIPDLKLKAGELYALAWTRATKNERTAHGTCTVALTKWYKNHYPEWLKEQLSRDRALRVVEEMEGLSSAASEKAEADSKAGGNLIIRSLLLEAIRTLSDDEEANPAQLAKLANAWARVNDTGVRGQEALDAGLQTLRDEIKGNPKALEQFNKLYAAIKARSKATP
jgi:hypothetical protein